MPRRFFTIVALTAAVLAFTGCRARSAAASPTPDKTAAAPGETKKVKLLPKRSTDKLDLQLQPPPSVADRVKPLAGDALDKALLPLDEIVKTLPAPAYLKPDAAIPAPNADEAPSAAIKAYVRGRQAYLNNDRKAIDSLEEARKLDPRSADVMRLLGIAYFTYGNQVRGAQCLADAVKIKPDDTESLFLLGRFAFEKQEWNEAVVALARSGQGKQEGTEPAISLLRSYYLGQSLLQLGYDLAGVEELRKYFSSSAQGLRTTRLYMEVTRLDRQRGRLLQEAGDALCRLGRFDEALENYGNAAQDPAVALDSLAAREIYALLATRRAPLAEQTLVERLRASQGGSEMLALVPYVAEHGGDRGRFAKLLRAYYDQNNRPAAVALAVAELLPPRDASQFLMDHLDGRPGDLMVYRGVIARLKSQDSPSLVSGLIEMIRRKPANARQYIVALFESDADADVLLGELVKLPGDLRDSAAGNYLRGALLEQSGRSREAASAYEKAIAADAAFLSPQLANVELYMRLERYDRALALLDRLPDPEKPDIRQVRAELFSRLEKHDDAMKIINGLLQEQPRNIEYRLAKAGIEHRAKKYQAADVTLRSVLDVDSTNERAFTHLFNLYEDNANPDTDGRRVEALLLRAQQAIPNARVTRISLALSAYRGGNAPRSESLVRGLLQEFPGDREALGFLSIILIREKREQDAVDLLLETCKARPKDTSPLLVILQVTNPRSFPQMDRYIAPIVQEISAQPFTLVRAEVLGELNRRQKKYEDAIAVFDKAIAQYPQNAADLYYSRSNVFQDQDKQAELERDLAKSLELDPDHDKSNNALGYMWVDQGKNLDKALEMIQKAVTADPTNVAYRDSLGWAYYKKGDFANAVEHLRRARYGGEGGEDAVIVDHYGDALWRLGQTNEAKNQWLFAKDQADDPATRNDAEMIRVRTNLMAKLKAVADKVEPPVAPVP